MVNLRHIWCCSVSSSLVECSSQCTVDPNCKGGIGFSQAESTCMLFADAITVNEEFSYLVGHTVLVPLGRTGNEIKIKIRIIYPSPVSMS